LLAPLLGVEGWLALRQLQRHPTRTGLTVAVLFSALVVALAFGISFLNNLRDIRLWYRGTIDVDFLIRAVQPDPALVLTPAPLPAGTTAAVRRLPGCAEAGRLRFVPAQVGGVTAAVLARDFPTHGRCPLVLLHGDPDEVTTRLAAGEVVLASTLARRLALGLGDEVELETRRGPIRRRVAGVAKEYTTGGLA